MSRAESLGWTRRKIKKGWMLICPCGQHLETVHGTPSDRNVARKIARAIDKCGREESHER